ncbi:hypothetical protein [Nocardia crassostreae]|uniref:hypothetical protein n=1 Tax=Nocardia crassostreae TaxID=53428 RepID=UPI000830D71E|nr:hypothetical protein [Nocardia crassostreae]
MDTRALLRLSAIGGLVCGAAIAFAGLTELVTGHKTTLTQLLNGGAAPFGIGLLVGLYLLQRNRLGRFGAVAFVVQFLGFAYFAGVAYTRNFVLVHLDRATVDELLETPARFAFLATAMTALLGTLLFAAALLRAGAVPRAATALYAIGLSLLCLTFLLPAPIVRVGHIVAGAGMIWLAAAVWSRTDQGSSRLAYR